MIEGQIINCPLEIYVGIEDNEWKDNPLAYVVYKKEDGTMAKETSFNNWCSKAERKTFKNEPISGFKVLDIVGGEGGGYGYNFRKAWFRILDPRGFEIEISGDNFIDILLTHKIDKGRIDGKFGYGWYGASLYLCDTNSKVWKDGITSTVTTQTSHKVDKDNIQIGAGYRTRDFEVGYYLGRFKWHTYNHLEKNDTDTYQVYNLEATPMYTFIGKNVYGYTQIFGYKTLNYVKFGTGQTIDSKTISQAWEEFNKSRVAYPVDNIGFELKKQCRDSWRSEEDRRKQNESYKNWASTPKSKSKEKYDLRVFKIIKENRLDLIGSFKFVDKIVNYNIRSFYMKGNDIIADHYIKRNGYSEYSYEGHVRDCHLPWEGNVSELEPLYGEDVITIHDVRTKLTDEYIPIPLFLSKTFEKFTVKGKYKL